MRESTFCSDGWASRQYGHSKSPYSTSTTPSSGPKTWSRSKSTGGSSMETTLGGDARLQPRGLEVEVALDVAQHVGGDVTAVARVAQLAALGVDEVEAQADPRRGVGVLLGDARAALAGQLAGALGVELAGALDRRRRQVGGDRQLADPLERGLHALEARERLLARGGLRRLGDRAAQHERQRQALQHERHADHQQR